MRPFVHYITNCNIVHNMIFGDLSVQSSILSVLQRWFEGKRLRLKCTAVIALLLNSLGRSALPILWFHPVYQSLISIAFIWDYVGLFIAWFLWLLAVIENFNFAESKMFFKVNLKQIGFSLTWQFGVKQPQREKQTYCVKWLPQVKVEKTEEEEDMEREKTC